MQNKLIQFIKFRKGNYIILGIIIALTLSVVSNTMSIVMQQYQLLNVTSDLNEEAIAISIYAFDKDIEFTSQTQKDVTGILNIPGVDKVSLTSPVPYGGGGPDAKVATELNSANTIHSSLMYVDEHFQDVLDVPVIEGRGFNASDIVQTNESISVVLINDVLKNKLFPKTKATGQSIYIGKDAYNVAGVVEGLVGANAKSDLGQYVVIFPKPRIGAWTTLLIKPSQSNLSQSNIQKIKQDVESFLYTNGTGRIVKSNFTIGELRKQMFKQEHSLNTVLIFVVSVFSFIAFATVYGLTKYNLDERLPSLAIMRAMGASVAWVRRTLVQEFGLIIVGGALLGGVGAWLLANQIQAYQANMELSLPLLLFGALLIVSIGGLAITIQIRHSLSKGIAETIRQK